MASNTVRQRGYHAAIHSWHDNRPSRLLLEPPPYGQQVLADQSATLRRPPTLRTVNSLIAFNNASRHQNLFQDSCPAGPYLPRSVANVAVGDVAWSNPSNALASDDAYATAITIAQTTQQLQASDFRFNIPTTMQIDGILVEVEAKSTIATDTVVCRIIKGGSVSATGISNDWTTIEAQVQYGGNGNLWGETWTPADINASNFGVSVRQESGLTATLSCDAIRVTVYCSVPTVSATGVQLFPPQALNLSNRQRYAAVFSESRPDLDITPLLSHDQIYGEDGRVPTYDWQLPTPPFPRRQENRTHLDGHLLNTLFGQDALYGSPGLVPSYDWQLPTVRVVRRHENRTHLENHLFNTLLGQDILYAAPGEVPAYDWQLPTPAFPRRGENRTFLESHLLNTLFGQDVIYGGPGRVPTYDWQLPTPPARRSIVLRTHIDGHLLDVLLPLPDGGHHFDSILYPQPRRAPALLPADEHQRMADLYSDIVVDIQGGRSLVSSRRSRRQWYIAIAADGITNILVGTLAVPVVQPQPLIYEFVNPRGREYPLALRTFVDDHTKNTLLGQDRIYGDPGQVPDYVDSRYRYQSRAAETWLWNGLEGVLQPLPDGTSFWTPNPVLRTVPRERLTWLANELQGILQPLPDGTRADFTMPRLPQARQQESMVQSLLQTLLGTAFPPGATSIPEIRISFRERPRQFIDGSDLLLTTLVGQDRLYGAPGEVPVYTWVVPPKKWAHPELTNWVHDLLPNLIGQDQVYGGPGHVPTYDWQNPRGYRRPVFIEEYVPLLQMLLGVIVASRRGNIEITDFSVGDAGPVDTPQGRIEL